MTYSPVFCIFRLPSNKVYGTVPPPPTLLAGVQTLVSPPEASDIAASSSTPFVGVTSAVSQGPAYLRTGLTLANTACYPHTPLTANGTSYIGYGGIYPQATPLQQVALGLRQSTSVTATAAPSTTVGWKEEPLKIPIPVNHVRPQKRKFKELPVNGEVPENLNQVSVYTLYTIK